MKRPMTLNDGIKVVRGCAANLAKMSALPTVSDEESHMYGSTAVDLYQVARWLEELRALRKSSAK